MRGIYWLLSSEQCLGAATASASPCLVKPLAKELAVNVSKTM